MTSSPLFDLATLGRGLPFARAVPDLEAALSAGACVVQSPPGSGKTTLAAPTVAQHLADLGRSGRVVVTQPRRVAVRAAARRLAELTDTHLGELVGYAVRGDARTSGRTRVEFVTPGLLVRRLLADPEMGGVDAVVLDEVHERSLDTDLLIGMLADVRALREDLLLVAMSATLDVSTFRRVLSPTTSEREVPVVDCPAHTHPLDVVWSPCAGPRMDARGVAPEYLEHVAASTVAELQKQSTSLGDDAAADPDILVFLPGLREVERVAMAVRTRARRAGIEDVEVLELHGRLDPREQDRITTGRMPGERRRVVVSTSLAESSLTVPGVRIVVDAGLSREPRRDAARGMSGLVTVACSRASAQQRAGRAARLGPGRVVRCYDEQTFARMPEHLTPEILTADLTSAVLTLASWGTPGGVGLRMPTEPPTVAVADANATLRALGALEGERLTDVGRRLAEMPADPRLGRALLDGAPAVGANRAAEVVAALSDDVRHRDADLGAALRSLSGPARQRWRRERDRLARMVGTARRPENEVGFATVDVPPEFRDGWFVALAYPERVARRVGDGVYLLASGTRAALPPASGLTQHEWLAVADVARAEGRVARGTGAVIRLAAPTTRELAEHAAAHLLLDEVQATWSDGRMTGRRVQALGAIEFSSTPAKPTAAAARQAVADALTAEGLSILRWTEPATTLRNRLAFCHHHLGEPWPAVDDAALMERVEAWLGPELDRLARGAKVGSLDLVGPLRRLLPWPEAAHFDDLAPETWQAPSGNRVRVRYAAHDDAGAPPVVAVKLQECFGLSDTPRPADGRATVQFHLLSPAGRPLAITDDLASFWAGSYAAVRAEMRGRYPKHPWPEDPTTHVPTARTKRRM